MQKCSNLCLDHQIKDRNRIFCQTNILPSSHRNGTHLQYLQIQTANHTRALLNTKWYMYRCIYCDTLKDKDLMKNFDLSILQLFSVHVHCIRLIEEIWFVNRETNNWLTLIIKTSTLTAKQIGCVSIINIMNHIQNNYVKILTDP